MMSRIRDIANLFSANTDAATDAEVASAISSHNTTANGHVNRGNTASRPASPSNGDVYANTETGYFEHYDGTSWTAVGAPASTPSSVVATNQGSGRSYNNGQASVAFTAGTITGSTYTVTSSPGSYTATGASSPLVVTGLQSSTQYTYTVVAANKFGTSSASTASSGVTATTVPQAPSVSAALDTDTTATITITAGATGGSAITQYSIVSDPVTTTQTTSSSPYTFTGLTTGTAYTFTATATNANGTSQASSASNSITPISPTSYESIATVTVGAGGSASVTLSSIPATYTHLQVRAYIRNTADSGPRSNGLQINGVTSDSYRWHYLLGNGASASSGSGTQVDTPYALYFGESPSTNNLSNNFSPMIVDILDYANTNKNKTLRCLTGFNANGYAPSGNTNNEAGKIFFASGFLNSTNAITSLTFTPQAGSYAQYTQFALYGIRGS